MTLFSYQQRTQQLIRDVAQKDVNPQDIVTFINEARQQLAGESACIRIMGTLAVTAGNQGPYAFSAINLSPAVGVQSVINVRTIWVLVGSGQIMLPPRPFEWLSLYTLNTPVPQQGAPNIWGQFGQGVNGTLYFNAPDLSYTLKLDTVCLPSPLVDDTTVEAIPPLWQTAVSYYASYLALLTMQTGSHMQEADKMLERYALFTQRARAFATPDVLPSQYPQVPNPVRANQIGGPPQQGAPRGATA